MLVFAGAGVGDDQIVDDDDSFADAIGSLATRWFWWFFLGGVGAFRFGGVQISPLGWVTVPLVLIALWRLIDVTSGTVCQQLQRAFGCALVSAVVTYTAVPLLPDARWVNVAVGYCFLMLGMAAFASGLRTWVEHRGCEPGVGNLWAWAGRWAWVNAGAVASVAVVGVVLDETDPTRELHGRAALGFVPIVVVAIAPFFTAAMATDISGRAWTASSACRVDDRAVAVMVVVR